MEAGRTFPVRVDTGQMDMVFRESASLFGTLMAGRGSYVARGAVVRSADGKVRIGEKGSRP
jgi:hypothetical protein